MVLGNGPKLHTAVIWALLAVITLVLASSITPAIFPAVFVFGGAALAALFNWGAFEAGRRFMEVRHALAMTERVKILEQVSRLTPDQIRLIESGNPIVTVLAGEPEPTYALRVGGGEIPFDFINQFLELGDLMYLCPVGTWSEGTRQREWAQLLTNHLHLMGFAASANGNKPARWLDRDRAMRWMGING